jgi:3-deoxy-manno-octulosonate cytidylyltransferase (CMP-KDO synthetase)
MVALIEASRSTDAPVITPYVECDAELAARLLADARNGIVGGTTVVTDRQDRALYFSKRPLPWRTGDTPPLKLHVGLYAYNPSALRRYAAWEPTPLEQAEGLEQLRFLEHGVPIQTVCVPSRPGGFWEVNNPDDIAPVERALAASA